MKFEQLQTKYDDFYVPTCIVKVKGVDLLKQSIEVYSVTVNNILDGAGTFTFTTNNPRNKSGNDFTYLEEKKIEVGTPVEIKIGYGDRTELKKAAVLIGFIESVQASFPANGISQLTVSGCDYLKKMMNTKKSGTWGSSEKPVTFSEIVTDIVNKGNYKFNGKYIEETNEKYPQIKKKDSESDYNFIKNNLARKVGFEVFVKDGKFQFRKPANDKTNYITTLTWGKSLTTFSPTINKGEQVSEVRVRDWDQAKQKPIVGIAKKGDEHGRDKKGEGGSDKAKGVTRTFWRKVTSEKDAEIQAKAILNKTAFKFVTGNGECIGLPDIKPGENIKLDGLGKMFNKVYYIEKTTHSISSTGYKTTFSVKENTI